MLYKKTSKAWKWWIAQQCPSAYTWVPKTKRKWVPKVRNESVTKKIVQLILFIVDSGCTKHMTGNLSLLCNFVEKYLGTVRFGNDQFAPILGYGDLVQGNITIKRVYYVEGLNHNLFSVGQFCDADLEVAFRKSTCFVRDLQGNDLLTGNRGTDLYTISLQETTSSTPICLMAKASPTQAWLWHRRLSHLNFDYINLLSKKDVVIGLPKLKYVKDQLCSSCEVSKAKRSSFKSKTVPSLKGRLNLLHMDLCGPMRVASINGKKYILVIVDDYSRYTWTLFLRSKDETPKVLKDFLMMIQRNLQALVISVRTDRGTEFLNKTLNAFFKEERIEHQTSTPRTPEQNGVVKDETALSLRMLERCYWLLNFLYSFGLKKLQPHAILKTDQSSSQLIRKRDGENLDKLKEKGIRAFVYYSTQSKGYRVYNKRTRLIVESIHHRIEASQRDVRETEYQLADMFTKALPEERFQYLVRRIGMRCLTPAKLEERGDVSRYACRGGRDRQCARRLAKRSSNNTHRNTFPWERRTLVILFSIHNDEWKSFQCHHQTALRSYALSWKPCQGDSLNLPDHRIHKDGDGDASFQLKSDSLPHAHAHSTKTFYKHQDSRIMKAQELKIKTSANSDINDNSSEIKLWGRLLESFQDDAKYEHVGQDTRSQGGKDVKDKQG
ncbi:retrovirus-related pol polyprotein from transposon TNT 1-94 [Tanacetum coccineum]